MLHCLEAVRCFSNLLLHQKVASLFSLPLLSPGIHSSVFCLVNERTLHMETDKECKIKLVYGSQLVMTETVYNLKNNFQPRCSRPKQWSFLICTSKAVNVWHSCNDIDGEFYILQATNKASSRKTQNLSSSQTLLSFDSWEISVDSLLLQITRKCSRKY